MKDTSSSFGVSCLICIMLLRDAVHLISPVNASATFDSGKCHRCMSSPMDFQNEHASGAAFGLSHVLRLRVLLL